MEAEIFIKVGAWKNFDEMEESISLPELNAMLLAIRKDQESERTFHAAINGIDLDKYKVDSIEEKKREIERRVAEKTLGFEAVERQELSGFGFDFESL